MLQKTTSISASLEQKLKEDSWKNINKKKPIFRLRYLLSPVEYFKELPSLLIKKAVIFASERGQTQNLELIKVLENFENGKYSKIFKDAMFDIAFGITMTFIVWASFGVITYLNPILGASLAIYEAIPGLGGFACLIQVAYLLFRRTGPLSFSNFREKKYKSGITYLALPFLAFGDINWFFATIGINAIREPELSKLMFWYAKQNIKEKIKEKIENIKNFLRSAKKNK